MNTLKQLTKLSAQLTELLDELESTLDYIDNDELYNEIDNNVKSQLENALTVMIFLRGCMRLILRQKNLKSGTNSFDFGPIATAHGLWRAAHAALLSIRAAVAGGGRDTPLTDRKRSFTHPLIYTHIL